MQLDFGLIDRDRLKCERGKIASSQVHDLEPILLMQASYCLHITFWGGDSVTYCITCLDYLFFSDFAALPNEIYFSNQMLYSAVYF